MSRWWMGMALWIAAAGCPQGPGGAPSPSDTAGTLLPTDTDTTGGPTDPGTTTSYGKPTSLTAECTREPNPLRFSCAVTVDPPQPVQVTFVRADGLGPTRTHTSDIAVGEHSVPLYFMGPDRDYTVTISAIAWPTDPVFEATVTTGIPSNSIGSGLTIEGTATAPLVGTELPCAGDAIAVIYDTTTGDLVWFQNLDPGGTLGLLDMVRFTDRHTIMGETGEHVVEMDLLGNTLTDFPATGLGGCCGPHHDMFERDGLFYLIHQYGLPNNLTLDALVVYDSAGNMLQHWYPDQVLDIPGNATGDYFHTNSIYVDASGDIYLDYLNLQTIIKLEGDVTSKEFGQPIWIMAPDGSGAIGNDFTVDWSQVGGANAITFEHNVHLTHDGRMMLLDNANGRALIFTVDEKNHTATVDAEFETHENSCGPQGTAMDTTNGDVFVGCNTEWLREYDGVTKEMIWEAEVSCRNGGGGGPFGGVAPTRWYPLEGW